MADGIVEERLLRAGIVLPAAPAPIGRYRPGVVAGGLLFVSGQTPQQEAGLLHPGVVGAGVPLAAAAEAAGVAAVNVLVQAKQVLGGLDRILRLVRLTGYVAAAEGFTAHPEVVDGASRIFVLALGEEDGVSARAAIGVANLPQGACVELEAVFEVSP